MSDLIDTIWRKSSYSGGPNGQCVEVGAAWRKSSYSGGANGQCVEVAGAHQAFRVRDTKDRDGGRLSFDAASWSSFMIGLRAGRFDR